MDGVGEISDDGFPYKELVAGKDDGSWIGNTARAAMLAVGLGLTGLGAYDGAVPEEPVINGEVVVMKDNVEGSPTSYFGFGVPMIVLSRFKRGKKLRAKS